MNPPSTNSQQLNLHFSLLLSDYVTAIAFSPDGETLAATSAKSEVKLWNDQGESTLLSPKQGQSLDCLGFSHDGQFLAVGGQGGIKIWRWRESELITTLDAPTWVDRLIWSPTSNQLAFGLGRYVQVWDAETNNIVVTLNFEASSILGMDWRKDGQYLAIAGYQGAKIWNCHDWDDDPYVLSILSASVAIAWSPDSKYIATGNMDRTISVLEWENPNPWMMRGFPGKIRHLAWSATTTIGAPMLASSSVEGIVVWEKQADDLGWDSRLLTKHTGIVQAIAFEPNSFLLASASADGWVCLWHKAEELSQVLGGAKAGFSCLAWHPQGQQLAAGGMNGELLVWSQL